MICSSCKVSNPTYDLRPYPPEGEVLCLECCYRRLQQEREKNKQLTEMLETAKTHREFLNQDSNEQFF